MNAFKKVVLAISLLLPLAASAAPPPGFWLENTVNIPKPFYILTNVDPLPKGGELYINNGNIDQYGSLIGTNLYRISLRCLENENEFGLITITFNTMLGIQTIAGGCMGGGDDPMKTILPKWDHYPFGKVDFFNYIPKK